MTLTYRCNNLEDTEKVARLFAETIEQTGAFVCLHGDIVPAKLLLQNWSANTSMSNKESPVRVL